MAAVPVSREVKALPAGRHGMSIDQALRGYMERLCELICSTQTYPALQRVMLFRLNMPLDRICSNTMGFADVAFDVTRWAEREGRLTDLADAIASSVPGRADVAELATEMRRALPSTQTGCPAAAVRPIAELLAALGERRDAWRLARVRNHDAVEPAKGILRDVRELLGAVRQALPPDGVANLDFPIRRIEELERRTMFRDGGKSLAAFWKDGDEILDRGQAEAKQLGLGAQ